LKDRLKRCGRYHNSPYQSPLLCHQRKNKNIGNEALRDAVQVSSTSDEPGSFTTSSEIAHSTDSKQLLTLKSGSSGDGASEHVSQSKKSNCLDDRKTFITPVKRISKENEPVKGCKLTFGDESDTNSSKVSDSSHLNEASESHSGSKSDAQELGEITVDELEKRLKEKQEELRKLKMVKMYRKKVKCCSSQTKNSVQI